MTTSDETPREPGSGEAEAPLRRGTRRRAASRPAGPPAAPEPVQEPAQDAPPTAATDLPAAAADPAPPADVPDADLAAEVTEARPAQDGPLFQVADPSPAPETPAPETAAPEPRRRRRSASRPAGPPVEPPAPAPEPVIASAATGLAHGPDDSLDAPDADEAGALDREPLAASRADVAAQAVAAALARVPAEGGDEPAVEDVGETPADDGDDSADDTTEDLGEDATEITEDDEDAGRGRRPRRRRGGRGRRRRTSEDGPDDAEGAEDVDDEPGESPLAADDVADDADPAAEDVADDEDAVADGTTGVEGEAESDGGGSRRRRRRRRSRGSAGETDPDADAEGDADAPAEAAGSRSRTRSRRSAAIAAVDDVVAVRGSTRLEAKRQRRRDGRDGARRPKVISEAEFLARRESVERTMVVRSSAGRTQVAVLEDGVLVEHYVARKQHTSMIGNVYLGKVQNVLPSMEAAFVDVGRGRNAVLYAGEVDWDAAGLSGQAKKIESALKSGDPVLVQVSKDPIGHKGARLTSQVSLPGRYLVYVPNGSMTGISRKLPDTERARLKKILKQVVPEDAGVIVRTAAEGASEEELARDVERLAAQWQEISTRAKQVSAPTLLHGEPDLTIKVVRDVFNEDFSRLVASGDDAWSAIKPYVDAVAPDLTERVVRWDGGGDVFAAHRVDEQIAKALERKVWLPSGGSLVIDRTEAMTVVDVNTGRFTGSGGNLEETVTKNNLEAAEEIVRQLRLRDIGGIIVVDFIDMVLESNRDLVLRRLVECLGRDRTKHQVAEVTSLGLVQMTRKRVGQGLIEAFSEPCEHCAGRGVVVSEDLLDHVHAPGDEPSAPAVPEDAGPGDAATPRSRRRSRADAARDAVRDAIHEVAAASRLVPRAEEEQAGPADLAELPDLADLAEPGGAGAAPTAVADVLADVLSELDPTGTHWTAPAHEVPDVLPEPVAEDAVAVDDATAEDVLLDGGEQLTLPAPASGPERGSDPEDARGEEPLPEPVGSAGAPAGSELDADRPPA